MVMEDVQKQHFYMVHRLPKVGRVVAVSLKSPVNGGNFHEKQREVATDEFPSKVI